MTQLRVQLTPNKTPIDQFPFYSLTHTPLLRGFLPLVLHKKTFPPINLQRRRRSEEVSHGRLITIAKP